MPCGVGTIAQLTTSGIRGKRSREGEQLFTGMRWQFSFDSDHIGGANTVWNPDDVNKHSGKL